MREQLELLVVLIWSFFVWPPRPVRELPSWEKRADFPAQETSEILLLLWSQKAENKQLKQRIILLRLFVEQITAFLLSQGTTGSTRSFSNVKNYSAGFFFFHKGQWKKRLDLTDVLKVAYHTSGKCRSGDETIVWISDFLSLFPRWPGQFMQLSWYSAWLLCFAHSAPCPALPQLMLNLVDKNVMVQDLSSWELRVTHWMVIWYKADQ